MKSEMIRFGLELCIGFARELKDRNPSVTTRDWQKAVIAGIMHSKDAYRQSLLRLEFVKWSFTVCNVVPRVEDLRNIDPALDVCLLYTSPSPRD